MGNIRRCTCSAGDGTGIRRVFLQRTRRGYHRDSGKPVRFTKRKENPRVGNDRACQNILSGNLRNQTDTVLLVAVKPACNHTAGIIE